jgi:RNA polymerase sigma-70 factor (ECF subfamily)
VTTSGRPRLVSGCPDEHERALVSKVRGGSHAALGELMDEHGEDLMRYLVVLLGRREEAEDLFQETWIRVMERIAGFEPERKVAPWLFRIARNLALDRLRWFSRWRAVSFDVAPAEGGATVPGRDADFAEQLVARELAHRLLAELPSKMREAVWLRFYAECTYEEIAELCRVPLGTVKSRLARALDRLATTYRRLEAPDNAQLAF